MRRAILLIPLLSAACVMGDGYGDVDVVEEEGVSLNGVSLNGVSLNGVSLNGVSLNGVSLNGVSLNGVSLNGVSLNGVTLSATNFSGTKSGQPISGAGFVGTMWDGTLSNGSTLKLRIDSRIQGTGANTDVWMYGVSYQTQSSWTRLCGSDPVTGAAILAVPVNGTWNYQSGVAGGGSFTASSTAFTFGCRGTAIAKCVEMGYKPWKTVSGKNLTNHHVACTRLLRADYCGDGTTYTVNGMSVDIYDNLGIQLDTMGWNFEAEWLPTGARCVAVGLDTRTQQRANKTLACYNAKKSANCGNAANYTTYGTLIMSEINPSETQ